MLKKSGVPDHVTVYPTLAEAGRIAVLIAYASEHFDEKLPEMEVKLVVSDFPGKYRAVLRRIDEHHSDPYAFSLREGYKEPYTEDEMRHLAKEGELKEEELTLQEGIPLRLTLVSDSLTLLELIQVTN